VARSKLTAGLKSRLHLIELEAREVPAVMLAQLPDQVLPSNTPLYLPVTVTNTPSATVTTTVTSTNPNAAAELVIGGQSVRLTVSGIDENNQPFSGVLTIRLFENAAPQATGLIKQLVTDGFYNGKLFHRIVPNFVIQGGSPNGDGVGGSTRPDVVDEFSRDFTFASNGLVAMANARDDNNNSQFFVTDLDLPLSQRAQSLNFNHTIVGILTEGFDVYRQIRNTPRTGESPNSPVTIGSATLINDTENAVIKVTPNSSFTGSTTLSILSSDGTPQTGSDSVVLTRADNSSQNSRPFLGSTSNVTSTGGTPVSISLTSTDLDGHRRRFGQLRDSGRILRRCPFERHHQPESGDRCGDSDSATRVLRNDPPRCRRAGQHRSGRRRRRAGGQLRHEHVYIDGRPGRRLHADYEHDRRRGRCDLYRRRHRSVEPWGPDRVPG